MEPIPDTLRPVTGSSRQKQALVMEELHRLAIKLGRGSKLPTVRDLSKQLNVNSLTLNKCLDKMEARGVLRCLQGSGIYVDAGVDQKRIALVFGSNLFAGGPTQFGSLLLRHGAKRASLHNERLSFYIDDPTMQGVMDGQKVPAHPDLVDAFREGKIDGVILMARNSIEQELWLRAQGVPMVSAEITQRAYSPSKDIVYFDYQSLIRIGVDKLTAAGCRTMGIIAATHEHAEMFRAELAQRGIELDEKWITDPPSEMKRAFEQHSASGIEAARTLLAQSGGNENGARADLPDGLLITDDMMAGGVLSFLSGQGIRIGQDLTVCSHSNKNSGVLFEWESRILRVEMDPEALTLALFEVLEALMAGKPAHTPRFIGPTV